MKIFRTLILLFIPLSAMAGGYDVSSPDGSVNIKVETTRENILWTVSHEGQTLLLPSEIGIDIEGLTPDYRVRKASKRSVSEVVEACVPVKSRQVKDEYTSLTLKLRSGLSLEFRAYDLGVAYRFVSSSRQPSIRVLSETSEWNFASDCTAYWAGEKNPEFISHCEAFFKPFPLSECPMDTYSYLPLSLSDGNVRSVITETALTDYPNMFLFPTGKSSLVAKFPQVLEEYAMRGDRDVNVVRKAPWIAQTSGSRAFPWRVMTIGDDCETLENNLPWLLGEPQVEGDASWIRPGKISWEWWAMLNVYGVDFKAGVNTETYKHYIDFAAEYGLEYILMDEGWSASTLDIKAPKPGLDVEELIRYGKTKGVGVVLWALWTPLRSDMDAILDVYEKWGVAGVKVDFMQQNDQNMVNFYEDLASAAFKRHLLVDFHGAFKPAGLQRKYPNVMTFEGVYGMEHDKCSFDISPDHDLVLPFTRMVAGPMDYTPGATNNATKDDFAMRWSHPMSQGTRAHQAALFTVFESPLQMLCDSPSNYRKNPEFAHFIAQIPTVWDETHALEAKAGEYLLLARRNADTWYIAALGNWAPHELSLELGQVLPEGIYSASIFSDGVNADVWAEDYKLETVEVSNTDILNIKLAPGGGWSAIIKAL